ncbi:hypothetical protein RLEG3_18680 [Rhizobium leguminosarum bv. trifolii WSM1689]|uniref:hypothetical protein n=1 Tax=Rhizobium leguminosarum TaxID=384 RepID=UPI0003E0BAB3|nr:hypothetical protein [Rhizobium leguminosarum]AHF86719.1 hypothetical protein RLEG3_18680 [Rhizobium leguminosarum bv. trifolii WSM1689]
MEKPKDTLTIQYGPFKATAFGRFAIIAVLVCVSVIAAGTVSIVGWKAGDWISDNHSVADTAK